MITTLHFLSQGSYQKGIGQDYLISMDQSSVSRCINEVTNVIIDVLGHVIKFPESAEEKNREKLL